MSLFPDVGLLASFLLLLFLYQLYTYLPVWNQSILHCESTSRHPHNKKVSVVPIMIIPSACSEPGNPSVSLLPLYGMCLCVLILLNSCMNTLYVWSIAQQRCLSIALCVSEPGVTPVAWLPRVKSLFCLTVVLIPYTYVHWRRSIAVWCVRARVPKARESRHRRVERVCVERDFPCPDSQFEHVGLSSLLLLLLLLLLLVTPVAGIDANNLLCIYIASVRRCISCLTTQDTVFIPRQHIDELHRHGTLSVCSTACVMMILCRNHSIFELLHYPILGARS